MYSNHIQGSTFGACILATGNLETFLVPTTCSWQNYFILDHDWYFLYTLWIACECSSFLFLLFFKGTVQLPYNVPQVEERSLSNGSGF